MLRGSCRARSATACSCMPWSTRTSTSPRACRRCGDLGQAWPAPADPRRCPPIGGHLPPPAGQPIGAKAAAVRRGLIGSVRRLRSFSWTPGHSIPAGTRPGSPLLRLIATLAIGPGWAGLSIARRRRTLTAGRSTDRERLLRQLLDVDSRARRQLAERLHDEVPHISWPRGWTLTTLVIEYRLIPSTESTLLCRARRRPCRPPSGTAPDRTRAVRPATCVAPHGPDTGVRRGVEACRRR